MGAQGIQRYEIEMKTVIINCIEMQQCYAFSVISYLQAEKMSFLCTQMQRGAAPQVPGVDLSSVHQQVLDYELLVAGSCYLKSRLLTKIIALLICI